MWHVWRPFTPFDQIAGGLWLIESRRDNHASLPWKLFIQLIRIENIFGILKSRKIMTSSKNFPFFSKNHLGKLKNNSKVNDKLKVVPLRTFQVFHLRMRGVYIFTTMEDLFSFFVRYYICFVFHHFDIAFWNALG